MEALSKLRDTVTALDKTDMRAAVDALDTWVNDNAADANQALPVGPRTNLTASQKAQLMVFVVTKRYITGV